MALYFFSVRRPEWRADMASKRAEGLSTAFTDPLADGVNYAERGAVLRTHHLLLALPPAHGLPASARLWSDSAACSP